MRAKLLSAISTGCPNGTASRHIYLPFGFSLHHQGLRIMTPSITSPITEHSNSIVNVRNSFLPDVTPHKHLVSSVRTDDDWEILIYKQGAVFEACFFRWAEHHEHAVGSPVEALNRYVEQRISILRSRQLKTEGWREETN